LFEVKRDDFYSETRSQKIFRRINSPTPELGILKVGWHADDADAADFRGFDF
jgi:hypothetical protein